MDGKKAEVLTTIFLEKPKKEKNCNQKKQNFERYKGKLMLRPKK